MHVTQEGPSTVVPPGVCCRQSLPWQQMQACVSKDVAIGLGAEKVGEWRPISRACSSLKNMSVSPGPRPGPARGRLSLHDHSI